MIDLKTENIISLMDACKLLPKLRGGKRPHFTTVLRWAMKGIHGTLLESIRIGGTLCTSEEALSRFFLTLSQEPASRSPGAEKRALEAGRQLTKEGI